MRIFPIFCAGCETPAERICSSCISKLTPVSRQIRGYKRVISLGVYEAELKQVVLEYKAGNHTLAKPLARLLIQLVPNQSFDSVSWIPASKRGRRERGFDQAKCLAKPVSRSLDAPLVQAVRRLGSSGQRQLGRSDRLVGPQLRSIRQPIAKPPGRVLVIDDVITTGSSLSRFRQKVDGELWAVSIAMVPNPPF